MARYEGQVALGKYLSRRRERKAAKDRARFAELLAEGMRPGEAGVACGYTVSWGRNTLLRLRRELGWQAV